MKKNNNQISTSNKKNYYESLKSELHLIRLNKTWKYIFYDILSYALFIAGCNVLGVMFIFKTVTTTITIISIIIGIVGGAINGLYKYIINERKETQIQDEIAKHEAENLQNKIEKDIFENSIKMSYKYLDEYYLQTREQAQKGFIITIFVSIFGACLIAVGIIAMFFGKTNPSYVTCASGIITEIISAIFFYLYNKTIISMSKYHNKLVLSHNVSIALKVADSLPNDEKVKTKNLIITELMKDINTFLIKSDLNENPKNNFSKRLIIQRRDNAIFFLHNGSQEMLASCYASNARMEQCKHFTILWRIDNASKSCHR